MADALHENSWVSGPRTVRVVLEFMRLWDMVGEINLTDEPDKLRWNWDAGGTYSLSSAYQALFVGAARPLGAKELWKTNAPPKVKHFFWIALHGRCWTAARRHRHGLQDSPTCILCGQLPEEIGHVLLTCTYSRELWGRVLDIIGLHALRPADGEQF